MSDERLPLPSVTLVTSLLHYDPNTGLFRWKPRPNDQRWTTRYAGTIAGTPVGKGDIAIFISGHNYKAHRLAWLIIHGEPVPYLIDHRDTDNSNNRIDNLRDATRQQNGANAKTFSTNSTGIKGISIRANGCYRARIMLNGVSYSGDFVSLDRAQQAIRKWREQLHGEFARHE